VKEFEGDENMFSRHFDEQGRIVRVIYLQYSNHKGKVHRMAKQNDQLLLTRNAVHVFTFKLIVLFCYSSLPS
jgi:hypothetical protein